MGNRVTRIGAKQPEVVLLALDLQHRVVCPASAMGPRWMPHFLPGEGATRGWPLPFGSLQLTIRVGGGSFARVRGRLFTPKRRIIRPVPGRSLPAYAGVIALAWIELAGGGDAGHAEACLREDRFNDLDLGGLSRSGCT